MYTHIQKTTRDIILHLTSHSGHVCMYVCWQRTRNTAHFYITCMHDYTSSIQIEWVITNPARKYMLHSSEIHLSFCAKIAQYCNGNPWVPLCNRERSNSIPTNYASKPLFSAFTHIVICNVIYMHVCQCMIHPLFSIFVYRQRAGL